MSRLAPRLGLPPGCQGVPRRGRPLPVLRRRRPRFPASVYVAHPLILLLSRGFPTPARPLYPDRGGAGSKQWTVGDARTSRQNSNRSLRRKLAIAVDRVQVIGLADSRTAPEPPPRPCPSPVRRNHLSMTGTDLSPAETMSVTGRPAAIFSQGGGGLWREEVARGPSCRTGLLTRTGAVRVASPALKRAFGPEAARCRRLPRART
jgi:hypothetical protein